MNSLRRLWLSFALFFATCSLGLSGCQSLTYPGFFARDHSDRMYNNLRAPGNSKRATGISNEARQIEQNLGI